MPIAKHVNVHANVRLKGNFGNHLDKLTRNVKKDNFGGVSYLLISTDKCMVHGTIFVISASI